MPRKKRQEITVQTSARCPNCGLIGIYYRMRANDWFCNRCNTTHRKPNFGPYPKEVS